jgi:hypothetical protein
VKVQYTEILHELGDLLAQDVTVGSNPELSEKIKGLIEHLETTGSIRDE